MEYDLHSATDPLQRAFYLNPFSNEMLVTLIIVILLLLLSALISGSEADYFSINRDDQLKLNKDSSNRKILKNLEKPERLLATILITGTLVNLAFIMLSARLIVQWVNTPWPILINSTILVLAISLAILVFGEILPKVYATRHPGKIAALMATPLLILERLFRPFNHVLITSSSMINRRFKNKPQKNISVNEITQALELTSGNEISEEKEILEGIVNFGNKNVSEIMCPRVDVVSVDIRSSFKTVLEVINNAGYSRIPVYSESFDMVRGILYIKDLLPYTEKGDQFTWQNLLRPPFFVPETKKVKDLLEDFQKNKIHMAVVVDEYGGSAGIVTMEDVLEEIVGDIADEFDEEESNYTVLGDNNFLFDGKILLPDFIEVVGCEKDLFDEVKGEADTLAGLILEIRGDLPALHERIDYRNFRFTIESMSNHRIRQIKTEIN